MKLFEIAKPRVRLGPDGKYYPAPVQSVEWDPNAIQSLTPKAKKKRAPRKPKMVAQQQQSAPVQPAAPPPPAPKTPLSAQQQVQQGALKTRLQQKYNRPVSDPAVKQQQQQTKVAAQQAASLNSRLDVSRGNFANTISNFAKGNHDQIPELLRVLARASLRGPGSGQTPNLPGRRVTGGYRRMRGEPRQVRRMNRQELDKYLQRNKIEVTEAQAIDLNRVAQIAAQMDPGELASLIRYIEDIQYEKVGPGKEPTGEYRKQPSMLGTQRDDTQKRVSKPPTGQPTQQPAKPSGISRFTNWLRGNP